MDRTLLLAGGISFAGVVVLQQASLWVGYIPPSTTLPGVILLTRLGIGTTILGLVTRGSIGSYDVLVSILSGFVLGIIGTFNTLLASTDYDHTIEVCRYSKI